MNRYQAQRAICAAEDLLKAGSCNRGLVAARAYAIATQSGLFRPHEIRRISDRLDRLTGIGKSREEK